MRSPSSAHPPGLRFSAICSQPPGPLPGLQLHLLIPVWLLLLPSTWYGDWLCQQGRPVFHLYSSPPVRYECRWGEGQGGACALCCDILGWGKEEVIPDRAGSTMACLVGNSVVASCPHPAGMEVAISWGSLIYLQLGCWNVGRGDWLPHSQMGHHTFILHGPPHRLCSWHGVHYLLPYFVYNKRIVWTLLNMNSANVEVPVITMC